VSDGYTDILNIKRKEESSMEALIVEAYEKTESKYFFDITIKLERLLKKHYLLYDPRTLITTGQVRRILERRGLWFQYRLVGI
jgi:hypothetical protein